MSVTGAFNGSFIAFDAGIVAGNPHNLNIASGENLRGLEKFAGTGNGDFLEADAPALINFAGDGNFFHGISFGRIVHGADSTYAGHKFLHQVEMMFHLRKAADAGNEGQMLSSAAARAGSDGIANACKDNRLVLD